MIKELVVLGWLHDFKFKEKRARNSIAESQTLLSARIEIYLHDILLEVNKPHSIESICWNTGLPLNIFCLTSCTLLSARVEMKIWFYIAVINFVVLYWVREFKFTNRKEENRKGMSHSIECMSWNSFFVVDTAWVEMTKKGRDRSESLNRTLHECVSWNIEMHPIKPLHSVALFMSTWVEIRVRRLTSSASPVALY